MKVEKIEHVDASDPTPDGEFDWRYEYALYRFSEDGQTLVARSYAHEPEEAHFLRIEDNGKHLPLKREHLKQPLALKAVRHLQSLGIKSVNYLGSKGYTSVMAAS